MKGRPTEIDPHKTHIPFSRRKCWSLLGKYWNHLGQMTGNPWLQNWMEIHLSLETKNCKISLRNRRSHSENHGMEEVVKLRSFFRQLLTRQMGMKKQTKIDGIQSFLGSQSVLQCPLDIATLDIAAALLIATSTPVTDLRHYINSNLVYNDLRFRPLFSK